MRRTGAAVADQAAIIAQRLGWNVLFRPALRNGNEDFGNAIISRYPLRLIRVVELPGKGTWYCREPRVALWSEVESEFGPIQIINTHLGLGRAERLAQAQWLANAQFLGSASLATPLVMLGDFNSVPGSRPYQYLTNSLRDVRDSLSQSYGLQTFPTFLPIFAFDRILVSENLRATDVHVHRTSLSRLASDHFPLLAELTVL